MRRPPSWRRSASPSASATATTLPEGTELVVTSPGWKPDSRCSRRPPRRAWTSGATSSSPGGCAGPDAGRPGSRSPAPTARPPPCGCSPRSWRPRGCAPPPSATSASRSRRRSLGERATYDVLAVELSSYQLHWAPSLRAHSAAVLNLAPDHLDWHGSMEAYAADKGRIYEGNTVACVYNAADKATEDLVREADVEEGCRAIGFTLGTPGPSQLGVVEGILVDRAFVENRQQAGPGARRGLRRQPAGPAQHRQRPRGGGAGPRLRRARPRPYATGCAPSARTPTASQHVADVDGVAYVDDSKATNTHAAEASLAAYEPIVWIAGGLAKGATFDELVAEVGGAAARCGADRRRPGADPRSPGATRPRGPGGRPRPDRHWGDARGGPGGGAPRRAGRHGPAGPGLRLDGHVRQLQQAGRRVRRRGSASSTARDH